MPLISGKYAFDTQALDRPAEALIPFARNARTHSDAQVAQIAASIREFGWTNPVLVDGENGIIAGHGRVLRAFRVEKRLTIGEPNRECGGVCLRLRPDLVPSS